MGGAFSIAQGGRGPLLLAPGRVRASWAGLWLFAGVIAVNQSRFMRLYGESAALRLQVFQFPKRSPGFLQALFRFLSLNFSVSPCCLFAHLHLLVYLQVQYELILVCMFERTDFLWLNIVRLF
jgi:hypothetical protein